MATLRSAMKDFLNGWENDVAPQWLELLNGVTPNYSAIDESLKLDAGEIIYPGRKGRETVGAPQGSHIFRALDGVVPMKVKVIIIGQDPYPRLSRATGRAFEQGDLTAWVDGPARVALSLKRIIQQAADCQIGEDKYNSGSGWSAIEDDVRNGSLDLMPPAILFEHWQKQGVLFLNTGLTLTRYQPGGHPHQLKGHIPLWAPVVGQICQKLASQDDIPIVFVSWGSKARQFLYKLGLTTSPKYPATIKPEYTATKVIDRVHPAVESFVTGKNVFKETNEALNALGNQSVIW